MKKKSNRDQKLLIKKIQGSSKLLHLIIIALITMSMMWVYSATRQEGYLSFAEIIATKNYGAFLQAPHRKEVLWIIMGIGVYTFLSFFNYENYQTYSKLVYLTGIALLVAVLGFGKVVNGSRRWLDFGFISIQPSEFVKIIFILTFSAFIFQERQKKSKRIEHFFYVSLWLLPYFFALLMLVVGLIEIKEGFFIFTLATTKITLGILIILIFLLGIFGVYFFFKYRNNALAVILDTASTLIQVVPFFILIAMQPDLGTSLVIVFIFLLLIFINGINWNYVFGFIIEMFFIAPIAYFAVLQDYQKERIKTFFNPESDRLGSGWNVIQSKVAVGSGELFGKGFTKGTQSELNFLPEAHTDFIGAVFLEEMGFVGGIILFGLYLILILHICDIGIAAENIYGKLVAYGIAGIFLFHTFINLGMIMGIMPVTGLPLLLMSYGGSSFLSSFTMLGIVQSIKIHR